MNGFTQKSFAAWTIGSALVWIAAILLAPLIGAQPIDVNTAFSVLAGASSTGPDFDIFFLQRLPRSLLGALAGGVLGIAGAAFQAILRNPLATPYTLGVASAGSLGAVAVISMGAAISLGPFSSVQLGALMGAAIDIAFIGILARSRQTGGTGGLLLAGITMSLICSAMMMLLRYLSTPYRLTQMDRWLMGGLDITGFEAISSILPVIVPALAIILIHTRAIDQLALGHAMAIARGVDVPAIQRDIFIAGSFAVAVIVSVTGPIGFVGLIVPHAVRRLAPRDHRIILIASFGLAGAFLVAADTVARTIVSPTELPVGVLTAVVGGPVFLWILAGRNRTQRKDNKRLGDN